MSSTSAVVLITGASSGFGRLIAETLARKHYQVLATMRGIEGRNANAARELRTLAERESLQLGVLELDVTSDGSVERAVAAAIERAGCVDVLINNAAYGVLGLTESFTVEQARRIFDTNFLGIARMNRAVLPHMRRKGSGLLMYVSSGAGRIVLPCMGLYTASKIRTGSVRRDLPVRARFPGDRFRHCAARRLSYGNPRQAGGGHRWIAHGNVRRCE